MTNPSFADDRSTDEPEVGTLDITPAIAAELLLKRRRVRRSLIEWCRHCGYEPAPHHRLLIDRLERVARGEIKRLAGLNAPGFGKIDLRIDPVPTLSDGECSEPRNPCSVTHDRVGREMGPQNSQPDRGAQCHAWGAAVGRQPCRRPLGTRQRRGVLRRGGRHPPCWVLRPPRPDCWFHPPPRGPRVPQMWRQKLGPGKKGPPPPPGTRRGWGA